VANLNSGFIGCFFVYSSFHFGKSELIQIKASVSSRLNYT